MKSTFRTVYIVAGTAGAEDFTAHVIPDKKNSSVHIHFHGRIFGSRQKPILVKPVAGIYPEDEGIEWVKKIVTNELSAERVQIKQVKLEQDSPIGKTKPPKRVILRFIE